MGAPHFLERERTSSFFKERMMSRQSIFLLALFLLMIVGWSSHGLAWSDVAHRLAVEEAIDALPKPLKGFYKDRKVYLMQQLEDLRSAGALSL
jgi:hypothetical protein